jgi:hypothetical protein
MLRLYENVRASEFLCGRNILTEEVFVIYLSVNAEISVRGIVWITTNCRFMSDILFFKVIAVILNAFSSGPQVF